MTTLLLSSSSMPIHNTMLLVLITIMLLLKWWAKDCKLQSYSHDLRHILLCKLISADSNWLDLTFRLKNLSSLNTFNQSPLFQSIQIQKIMFQSMVILAQHPAGDIHNMTHLEIPSLSQVHFFKKMIFSLYTVVFSIQEEVDNHFTIIIIPVYSHPGDMMSWTVQAGHL